VLRPSREVGRTLARTHGLTLRVELPSAASARRARLGGRALNDVGARRYARTPSSGVPITTTMPMNEPINQPPSQVPAKGGR